MAEKQEKQSEQKNGQAQESGQKQQQNQGRTPAQWITFGVSLVILLVLVGAIVVQFFTQGNSPASIQVQPQADSIRHSDGFYFLPVLVKNQGGRTAQDVRVAITLQDSQNHQETATFSIRFLPGGDRRTGVAGFRQDPQAGQISIVVSYLQP